MAFKVVKKWTGNENRPTLYPQSKIQETDTSSNHRLTHRGVNLNLGQQELSLSGDPPRVPGSLVLEALQAAQQHVVPLITVDDHVEARLAQTLVAEVVGAGRGAAGAVVGCGHDVEPAEKLAGRRAGAGEPRVGRRDVVPGLAHDAADEARLRTGIGDGDSGHRSLSQSGKNHVRRHSESLTRTRPNLVSSSVTGFTTDANEMFLFLVNVNTSSARK